LLLLSIFDIEVRTKRPLFSRVIINAFLVINANKKLKPSPGYSGNLK
jgi:hypothetical protein